MIELHIIFKGKVQGVGFRWTILDHAEKFKLTGTTKNLKDGTVEVFAQGPQEALEEFFDEIQSDPGLAHIDSTFSEYTTPTKTYSTFRVLH